MCLLEIILLFLALALSATSGYFICVAIGWPFFWIAILLVLPIYVVLFYLWVLFLFLWGLSFDKKKEVKHFSRFYYSILYSTDKAFVRINRVYVRIRHEERIPEGNFVLMSNHISNWDQMAVIASFKKRHQPICCVTKIENLSFPIAGPFIHHSGFIPINREDPKEGKKAILKAVSFLKNKECNVYICPEGTRNKSEAPLLPFHAGSFSLAIWAKAPIVLICIKGSKEIKKNAPWRKSYVDIDVVKVIRPEEYEGKSPGELAKISQNIILDNLLEDSLTL